MGAQKPDSEQTGLVIKVGGEKGDTGDIFVEQLSGVQLEQILGQDQTVIVQMSDILSKVDNAYFAQSLKSFTIFPAWANTQAGVKFEVKDIKFVK